MTDQTTTEVSTTTVEVPAKHADLVQRLVEALKKDEQWIVDNVEAGIKNIESLFEPKPSAVATTEVTSV